MAIARALANSPRIILADEPTAALDSQRAAVVMDLLHRVATDHEAAILVVTHDEKIFGHFDRLIRLRDGHIEAEEPMRPAGIDQPPFAAQAKQFSQELIHDLQRPTQCVSFTAGEARSGHRDRAHRTSNNNSRFRMQNVQPSGRTVHSLSA